LFWPYELDQHQIEHTIALLLYELYDCLNGQYHPPIQELAPEGGVAESNKSSGKGSDDEYYYSEEEQNGETINKKNSISILIN
jgi:hypothetical protein